MIWWRHGEDNTRKGLWALLVIYSKGVMDPTFCSKHLQESFWEQYGSCLILEQKNLKVNIKQRCFVTSIFFIMCNLLTSDAFSSPSPYRHTLLGTPSGLCKCWEAWPATWLMPSLIPCIGGRSSRSKIVLPLSSCSVQYIYGWLQPGDNLLVFLMSRSCSLHVCSPQKPTLSFFTERIRSPEMKC